MASGAKGAGTRDLTLWLNREGERHFAELLPASGDGEDEAVYATGWCETEAEAESEARRWAEDNGYRVGA